MRLYQNQPSGTVDRARDLRRNASQAELRLLRALKEAFPALKWRHQVPVGPFYADLLCFSEKVVIEVDGGEHANTLEYDVARTRFIEGEGYCVVRFWNNDVLGNIEGVIAQISLSLQEREEALKARKGEGERSKVKGASVITNAPSPDLASLGHQHWVNRAPHGLGRAGGTTDPMLPTGEGL